MKRGRSEDIARPRQSAPPEGGGGDAPESSVALAEQPEQRQEEVDEVEVELERADDRHLVQQHLARLDAAVAADVAVERAQLLRVVGGEAREDDHAAAADDEVDHGAAEEEVEHERADHPEEAHEEERAHAREVLAGDGAVEAHRPEHRRAEEERARER